MSIGKDAIEVGLNEEALNQTGSGEPVEGDLIVYVIGHKRSSTNAFEPVFVFPEVVGTPNLLIHEAVGRIPDRDVRAPEKRNPVQMDAVVNQGTLAHVDGPRSKNMKTEPRGGELLEIFRVRKEGKQGFDGKGKPLFSMDLARRSFHIAGCIAL